MASPTQKTLGILGELVPLEPAKVRAWLQGIYAAGRASLNGLASHPALLPDGDLVRRCFEEYEAECRPAAARGPDDPFPSVTQFVLLLASAQQQEEEEDPLDPGHDGSATGAALRFGLRLLAGDTRQKEEEEEEEEEAEGSDSAAWVAYYTLRALREMRAEEGEEEEGEEEDEEEEVGEEKDEARGPRNREVEGEEDVRRGSTSGGERHRGREGGVGRRRLRDTNGTGTGHAGAGAREDAKEAAGWLDADGGY